MHDNLQASARTVGGRWADSSGKLRFQLIVLACLLIVNTVFFFTFDFTGALARRDRDSPWYTQQLQDLLQHHKTPFMWPRYRVLVPALSLGVSAVLRVSYGVSMQILSGVFMLLTIFLFYRFYPMDRRRAFLLSAVFLSFPVVMLYSLTYWIELPFLASLIISFWLWDRFIHTGKISDFLLTTICSVAGLLIKESFLVHVLVLGAYLVIFHRGRLRPVVPCYLILAVLMLGLYYVDYFVIFNSQKKWIIGSVTTNTITAAMSGYSLSEFAKYLSFGRGGLPHALADVLLALGGTNVLVAFLWWNEKARARMLVYGLVLLAFLVFITFNIATEVRYVILCFAPSYLVLVAKRIKAYEKDQRLGLFLGANYIVNLAGALGYSLMQHGVL